MTTYTFGGAIIQTYTVTVTGTYDIAAFGAQGGRGDTGGSYGGLGAEISGDFSLVQGAVLRIVVGGAGGDAAPDVGAGGGGGGSFVIETFNGSTNVRIPLVIAGGGGGGGGGENNEAGSQGDAGQTSTSGTSGHFGGGTGGTGGSGGGGGGLNGGGGGGYSGGIGGGDASGTSGIGQGSGYGGGIGGSGEVGYAGGGYGGGGGAGIVAGGGGGGFSGGGGGAYVNLGGGAYDIGGGGGGGSLDTGTPLFAVAGANALNGSVTIDLAPACFLRGTHIQTPTREVAVEDLAVGDTVVVLLGGRSASIVWIGRRDTDCARHPDPSVMWPVRVAKGALGRDLPRRDLILSPDHAIYLADVLIPIKYLINGSTIAQVPMDRVTYYHVELPRHDVLLAEGLPAESYLDTGGRVNFDNAGRVLALHPDFSARQWEAAGCAPLVVTGPSLDAARQIVAAHNRGPTREQHRAA